MNKKIIILFLSAILSSCSLTEINSSKFSTNNSFNYISSNETSLGKSSSISTSKIYLTDNQTSMDPYINVSKNEFYSNYQEAISYEDAMYRTKHGLLSGSIISHSEKPVMNTVFDNGVSLRFNNATYYYNNNEEPIAFNINTKSGSYKTIYYNAAYISLEEVAAYILAFGEVPPNNNYDKGKKKASIDKWGKYGRVNIGNYSNNIDKYPFEPELPLCDSNGKTYKYTETDIGLQESFYMSTGEYIDIYNDGNSIARGVCRIVFTSSYYDGTLINDINERHVFYTYNHYNDFQEYLNYYGGWSNRFGNETSGNPYCNNPTVFYNLVNPKTPTPYIKSIIINKNELN